MSDRPSERAAADRMWKQVPAWARFRDRDEQGTPERGVLRGLVEALGAGLDAVRDDALRLLDDLFVETCDPRLVPLIADLVGVSIDPVIPIARQRHQVKYALHLRRRKGTAEQLEALGWQITGFRTRVHEARSAQRSVFEPLLSARVNGAGPGEPSIGATAARISGRIPPGKLRLVMDVAWPVRRAQLELERIGPDLYAVDAREVGLRRADGSPILRHDDPAELVGPGRAIEVSLIGADFPVLGKLKPRFMSLPEGAPPYVPDHTLAIDPERGRVAGPTAPMPGIRAYRRYRLQFWRPTRGELVCGRPAPLGGGVFAFAADARLDRLTDAEGAGLLLAFEGERAAAAPAEDQRLLVVREPGQRLPGRAHAPFVLLPPGQALTPGVPASQQEGALLLDGWGLNRLFSIEDEWGWDRFRTTRLVSELGREAPPDDTVEVDLARGRFQVGPAHEGAALHVRYCRRYDVASLKRRGVEALRRAAPLGRALTFAFRDTAPGSSEEVRS